MLPQALWISGDLTSALHSDGGRDKFPLHITTPPAVTAMLCRTAAHTLRSSTSISRTIYIRPTVTSALFHKQSKPTLTRTMATEIKTFNTPKSAQRK